MEKNQLIRFDDDEITVIYQNEVAFVSVRSICEAIGLDAKQAIRNINNHQILGTECVKIQVNDASNRLQSMVFLPIQYVNGWLFTIDAGKVRPEKREKLLRYQRDCFSVLFEHLNGYQKQIRERLKKQHALQKLIKELENSKRNNEAELKRLRAQLDQLQRENFAQIELFQSNQSITLEVTNDENHN